MPLLFVNEHAPPGIKLSTTPERAAVGLLPRGTSMAQVAAFLVEHDIPEDRIHFLSGEGGVAFLQQLGSWLSRAVSEGWSDAMGALADGEVIVGVFDVDEADAAGIRQILVDAGLKSTRYYGNWTWSE